MNLGKWHKISLYQEKAEDNNVRCHICPHNCLIHDGGIGICKTRVNKEGILYTIAYGNPCSISIDPIEKKPLFHFFPGERIYSLATAGCNFRCLNCQNWQISQTSPQGVNHYEYTPEQLVEQAISHHTKLIAFTYTEPTVFFEYMYDTAKITHERGLKTVFISNGYINRQPLSDLCQYLDAANIDLKCFDDAVYRKLNGGKLQPVLDTLKMLKEKGVWLEITNLLIPIYTDNPEMIKKMCEWLVKNGFTETPLHFSRFFPDYKLINLPPTPESSLIEAKNIALNEGLKYVYIGNIPSLNGEDTLCPSCKHTIIERNYFTVDKNYIKDGKCNFCGEPINGVWK
jgi:Pyruvate-formate lyase-activating enzyme